MRSIWSGAVAFGLVSVPVRMESAVEEHKLHFHFVHERDGGRIGYRKVCKAEDDKPVDDDEIVKAFEVKKGTWVYLEDEDFESAALDKAQRTIDIHAFVQENEIDPVFFERSYFLTPQDGAEKVYALLARAMEETGLAAVGTFVMRDRQHLACLRVRERAIQLERMHFADRGHGRGGRGGARDRGAGRPARCAAGERRSGRQERKAKAAALAEGRLVTEVTG